MTADSNDDGDESQSDNRSSSVLAAGGTKKIIGKLSATDGIGVFGYATGSGTTCGVRGKVDSASGYGLATPDDAKIDVLHAVEDAGGVVSDFDLDETSLEEMFAAYTVDSEGEAPMETDPVSPVADDSEVDA